MNFAGILAAGKGKRMGENELPKQYLKIGEKPIIIHTIEKFLKTKEIDEIIVAVPEVFFNYTKQLIEEYFDNKRVYIISGGKTRNDTIINICEYILNNFDINNNDIIVTHDAVRPFVTTRIIKENIEECKRHNAVDTCIPAFDTIVEAIDGVNISNIPIRSNMYQGQTPQTFKIRELLKTYSELTKKEKEILTDAAKIYVLKNKKVKIVMGESYNMKITTTYDLKLANLIFEKFKI